MPKGRHILSRRMMTDNSALQLVIQSPYVSKSSLWSGLNVPTERCTLLAMNEQRSYDYTYTADWSLKSRQLLRRS